MKVYGKCPKISNTLFHAFWLLVCAFNAVVTKIHSGMANNVDPDQTKEQTDLGLHYLHMPFGQKLWCTKF